MIENVGLGFGGTDGGWFFCEVFAAAFIERPTDP
jgi:hypothetical protein